MKKIYLELDYEALSQSLYYYLLLRTSPSEYNESIFIGSDGYLRLKSDEDADKYHFSLLSCDVLNKYIPYMSRSEDELAVIKNAWLVEFILAKEKIPLCHFCERNIYIVQIFDDNDIIGSSDAFFDADLHIDNTFHFFSEKQISELKRKMLVTLHHELNGLQTAKELIMKIAVFGPDFSIRDIDANSSFYFDLHELKDAQNPLLTRELLIIEKALEKVRKKYIPSSIRKKQLPLTVGVKFRSIFHNDQVRHEDDWQPWELHLQ